MTKSSIKWRGQVNKIHKAASNLVNAHTQAELAYLLEDSMTDEEHAIYKRGRNAKSYTIAKNASMSDYRKATGFEALMGYLYLAGKTDRMLELIYKSVEAAGMEL